MNRKMNSSYIGKWTIGDKKFGGHQLAKGRETHFLNKKIQDNGIILSCPDGWASFQKLICLPSDKASEMEVDFCKGMKEVNKNIRNPVICDNNSKSKIRSFLLTGCFPPECSLTFTGHLLEQRHFSVFGRGWGKGWGGKSIIIPRVELTPEIKSSNFPLFLFTCLMKRQKFSHCCKSKI